MTTADPGSCHLVTFHTHSRNKIWPGIPPRVMLEVNKDSTEAFTGDSSPATELISLQLVDSTQKTGVPIFETCSSLA